MDAKGRQELKAELKRQGAAVALLDEWPAKATYYKPNGEAMPNLPSDPWSMQRYFGRGYTLAPPQAVEESTSSLPSDEGVHQCEECVHKCNECDFEADTNWRLQMHKRKHKRESEKGGNR